MDKKNKIFFIVLFLLIFGSIGATYLRIVVFKNYIVEAQVDCDPETEKCFVWECDPASTVEGEACTGDAENDTWYYQLVKRKAYNVPLCNPDEDENLPAGEAECVPMECDATTEKDCEIIFCDDENKIEQEVECSDPAQYLLDNPAEEEDVSSEEEGSSADEAGSSADEAGEDGLAEDEQGAEIKDEETKNEEVIN